MAENPLSDGTQALLDEFARRRGLSKRAMAELRKSLAGFSLTASIFLSHAASIDVIAKSQSRILAAHDCVVGTAVTLSVLSA